MHQGTATASIASRATRFGAYSVLVKAVYHIIVEHDEYCAATWKTGEEGYD